MADDGAPPRSGDPRPIEAWEEFVRASDGLERLWTPHRMVYIEGQDKPETDAAGPTCPFCRAPAREDEAGLVVHRGRLAYAVLNLYPYNPGHLMVCPYEHVADWTDLSAAQRSEVCEMTAVAMRVIRTVSRPDGFNLGMNQGAVAGAGIAGHLHQHVVPRWTGDANFLPIVARTKAVPQLLAETRDRIAQAWSRVEAAGPSDGGDR